MSRISACRPAVSLWKASLSGVLLLLLAAQATLPAAAQTPLTFAVQTRASTAVGVQDALQMDVRQRLYDRLAALPTLSPAPADSAAWLLQVGTHLYEQEAGNLVAISVVTLYHLPEAVVALGAEHEVFFANVDAETRAQYPEDGAWIRRSVSGEYLQQFRLPQDLLMEVVPVSELDAALDRIVARFTRHWE